MEFREGQSGCDRSTSEHPHSAAPPLPAPPQIETLIDLEPVFFKYTLSVSTLAGPIFPGKERQKFGSVWPVGPPGVLTKEDQTAPYQTAPQKLH
jgi:hypothetical protein